MFPPFQIKICGVTTPEDARAVCRSGADAIGLNFYPPSPRFLTDQAAATLVEAIDHEPAPANRSLIKVGVFVNASADQIAHKLKTFRLDAVQFHGDEAPEIAFELREIIAHPKEVTLIRAIRTSSQTGEPGKSPPFVAQMGAWSASGVDAFLIDAAAPGQYGGTGTVVDWGSLKKLDLSCPVTLAGGLTPQNVSEAIQVSGVRSVDVASGVESAPGVKDLAAINEFVRQARIGFASLSAPPTNP